MPGESTNFLVAGMLPNTTYLMRHVLDDGTASAPLTFTTGSLPTNLTFPTFTVQQAPDPGTDLTQDIVFHVGTRRPDRHRQYPGDGPDGQRRLVLRPGGQRVPQLCPEPRAGRHGAPAGRQARPQSAGADTLREVDLAGDTLRETNIDAVNAELAALGQPSIIDFNHDAQRLPNGDTAVLAATPRTIDIKGKPTKYDGDMVLVLDQNFQVAWVWDSFDVAERPTASPRWARARPTGRTPTPSPGRRRTGTWSSPCAPRTG